MSVRLGVFAAAALALAAPASAQMDVKYSLDWKFEGPAAPFFVAIDKGYYKQAGMNVTMDTGNGSLEAIPRVAGGTYQFGFADINTLIKFRDKNPTVPLKAVMMVYDRPAFSIVSLAKSGIKRPKDLEGRVLGAPAADGAFAQWPTFVKVNGIEAAKVKIENVGFPLREPMLAEGKVDAITGFSFSAFFNLKAKGLKDDEINVMFLNDHGLELYGNAIIVNPEFATRHPDLVKGFVTATIKGWADSVADPKTAVAKHLMPRASVAREPVEAERLVMALRDNVVTPYVKANGMGGVDMAKLAKAIDQIAISYEFTSKPKPDDVFTSAFLPPPAERKIAK